MRIPNPTKKITVDCPIDRIRMSVKMLPYYHKKYKVEKYNDTFNQYTFASSEFLSAGAFVDIHLNSVGESKTEIFTEVRRKIGSFNESQEITYANRHIDHIIDSLGKLTEMPEEELRRMYEGHNLKTTNTIPGDTKKEFYRTWWFWLIVVIFFGAIISNLSDDQKEETSNTVLNNNANNNSSQKTDVVKINKWPEILDSLLKLNNKKIYSSNTEKYSGLNFKVSNTFTFDRYDDTYHYATAERGDKYIISNVIVSSKIKDPNLCAFAIYSLESDSSLTFINTLEYRFQRWEDYATYLGNYQDKGNDFAYSENVKMTLGAAVSQEKLKNKIFIISNNK